YLSILVLLQQALGYANLARNDHMVRGCQRFAGDANAPGVHPLLLRLSIDKIHDLVRDAISYLVRMTFGNRLAGEKIVSAYHGQTPLRKKTQPILCSGFVTHSGITRSRESQSKQTKGEETLSFRSPLGRSGFG